MRQEALNEITILLELRRPISEKIIGLLKERISRVYGKTLVVHIKQVPAIIQDGPKFKVFVPLKNNSAL